MAQYHFLIGDKEGRFSNFSQPMPEIAQTTLIKSGFSSDLSFFTSLLTWNLESMEGSQKLSKQEILEDKIIFIHTYHPNAST